MKQFSYILFVILCAIPTGFAYANSIHLDGSRAGQLMKALVDAGAKEEVIPENAHLTVEDLICRRLQRPDMPIYCECTFQQAVTSPPSAVIQAKNYKVAGHKAAMILEAEKEDGVEGESTPGGVAYSVSSLSCDGQYFGNHTDEECDLN